MDPSYDSVPVGMAAPTSDEQLRAVETLVVHYERLLSAAHAATHDWERVFDAIEDPICVMTPGYRLLAANAAYRRTLGPAYAHGGQHYCFSANAADGMPPASPCIDCPLPETVRTGRPGFVQQEWQSSGETGASGEHGGSSVLPQSRVYQRWTYPVVATDGKVVRIVEVIKDVTEQERMRRTVTQTEALREADRLKAELLGTVSHELRSPLTAIKGYAATLLRHERRLPREERHAFLEAIGEASDRLEVIINRLLEISQLETGGIVPHLAPLDVTQVAREAIASAEQQAEASASGKHIFSLHLLSEHSAGESTLPLIDADHRLLRDTLDNLLENAVKYSPAGGRIDVTLGISAASGASDAPAAIGEEATSPVHSEVHPKMLEIVVRDPGLGIPAEHLGRVFERFHRVDTHLTREVDGLGLGLAMCKRIAELHGGAIWAESAPGEGSAFHLLLPLVAARASSGKPFPVS